MRTTIFLGLLFGFLQGIRHAFEPDHVVAVSTMLSEQSSGRARVGYAARWGIGHAATLTPISGALMFFRVELPPRLDAAFELAVALMLIALGLRALRVAVRQARTRHGAEHGPRSIAHRWKGVGPLAMGMVHGLAGSGALTALVAARLPSAGAGLLFMALFGAGATIGMACLAGAAGVPLSRLLAKRWGAPLLLGITGTISLSLGTAWLVPAVSHLSSGDHHVSTVEDPWAREARADR